MKQKSKFLILIMCLSLVAGSVLSTVSASSPKSQATLLCSDFDVVIAKI